MPRYLSASLALGMLLLAGTADAGTPGSDAAAAPSTGAAPIPAGPVVRVGEQAPDFALPDTEGAVHRLSGYRDRIVVLEWFNPGCPFVKYAYGEGILQALRERWTAEGVAWLAINSSAPGKQGHGVEVNARARRNWGIDRPVLLDETGAVGHRFGARATPQFIVIDRGGVVRYDGGLDDAPLGLVDEGGRVEYLDRALRQLSAGDTVTPDHDKPYGCAVKYDD